MTEQQQQREDNGGKTDRKAKRRIPLRDVDLLIIHGTHHVLMHAYLHNPPRKRFGGGVCLVGALTVGVGVGTPT